MKVLWTGTDSLMLLDMSKRKLRKKPYWLLFRMFARLLDLFTDEHYCDSDNVAENLRKFKMKSKITVQGNHLLHTKKYPKKKHKGFNIMYYLPKNKMELSFGEWLYGYDIFLIIKKHFKNYKQINFIELSGKDDMEKVFPIIDFYLRPNRHDGASRLRQECDIQDIPYYWTYNDPDVDEIIDLIQSEYDKT